MESTAFNRDAFYHAAWITLLNNGLQCCNHAAYNPLHSIGMLWAMLHKIHCIQSGCTGHRCMDSTAYNPDPLRHNAWNPLHSMTLHGIHCIHSGCFGPCCITSTAFNHPAWSPLHSIRMHFTTLHGVHCIQSQFMESTAFNRDALGHAA